MYQLLNEETIWPIFDPTEAANEGLQKGRFGAGQMCGGLRGKRTVAVLLWLKFQRDGQQAILYVEKWGNITKCPFTWTQQSLVVAVVAVVALQNPILWIVYDPMDETKRQMLSGVLA